MKIGKKLTLAFAAFALFFAFAGTIAVLNLQNLNSLAEDSYQRITKPLGTLLDIAVDHQKIRVAIRDSILHTDLRQVAIDERSIGELYKEIDVLTAEYAKTIISDEGRILFSDYRTASTHYRTELNKVLALSRENRNVEAVQLLDTRMAPIANTLQNSIDALVASKNKAQAQRLLLTHEQTEGTTRNVLLLIGGAIALAIGLGLLFNRNLTKPVSGSTAIAIRFAGGQFDQPVPERYRHRKDEIGRISDALETLRLGLAERALETWIKEDITAVSRQLQTQENLAGFTDCLMREIHRITNVPYQALYLADEASGRLVRRGNAGGSAVVGESWGSGEGLAGECFMLGKALSLDCPPDHPIGLPTGAGVLPLSRLQVWPIESTSRRLGVVEIGCLAPLGEREQRWLEALLPFLALNLEILDRNVRTQDLLAETQRQANDMMHQAAQLEEQTIELEAQQLAIRETEAWFRGIIESAPDGMLVINEEGRIILANPQIESTFGYEPGKLVGEYIEALVPEASRGKHVGLRDNFMRENKAWGMGHSRRELRGVAKDGRLFPVEVGLSMLPAVGGHGVCVCASVRDISERREAEDRLAAAEEKSRLILGSVGDGIFGMDHDGIVTFVNPAVERILGFSEAELVGQGMHAMVQHHHADGSEYPVDSCPMRFTLRDGQARTIDDEVLWTKDGRAIPVEYSTSPIFKDGQVVGVVVTFKDISERIEAQERLNLANFQSGQALDLTKAGYWMIDYADDAYYTSSERAAALFGENPKPGWRYHLTEEWFNRIALADPEIAEATGAHYAQAVAGEVPRYDCVYPYLRPVDGKKVWIRAIGNVVRDKDGKPLFMYGVTQDITEQKLAEHSLQVSERQHRIVFEKSPLGMIYFSHEGVIIDCNHGFVEMMGSTREKLIGFNTARDSNPKMREALKTALAGVPSAYEDTYTSVTGGRTIFMRVIFNPVNPEVLPTEVIATLEDITAAKQAADAVLDERRRLQEILDKCPIGIAMVVKDQLRFGNPQFFKTFGVEVGGNLQPLWVQPEERDQLYARLAKEGVIEDIEVDMYNRDHELRQMLVTFMSNELRARRASSAGSRT
jgi:PAS domain S-box-containing protein